MVKNSKAKFLKNTPKKVKKKKDNRYKFWKNEICIQIKYIKAML